MGEKIDVIEQGSLGTTGRRSVALTAEQDIMQMEKIADMELLREDGVATASERGLAPQVEVVRSFG